MASNPPGACCAQGFKHEGTPVGEVKKINDIDTYIVYPKDNKTPEKAVLFLSDIFGLFTNAKLVADEFANNGYLCVLPDLFNGDAIEPAAMESGKFDIGAWFPNHQPTHVDPIVESTIKYIKGDLGVKRIAAVGYCFGAKYVCRFMKDGQIDVGFNAHPSFVTHEELGAIQGPLSIAAAQIDNIFTTQLRHESEDTGFAVRADLSNPHFKWSKEQAFCQAVAWFRQYL